ncbi:MAG: radical SAM protein [Bacteroidetes bacterium]|nr:radical SAM protein [Bacteroidota bacterium]
MFDSFNRPINYLRVSITDRCNLRCVYCMPEEGIRLINHSDIISYEEIIEVIREGTRLGITKVRITGGEPLVRKGVVGLVSMIAGLEGITDFGMTTNGILLGQFAQDLAKEGLHRINISLDTVNPEKYKRLTRGGDVEKVFEGVDAAKKAGISPIKINCVVKNSSLEPDAVEVRDYCRRNDLEVRFIHEMDLETGCFTLVEGGDGGNCKNCNRLRLTADGKIKPCLFNNIEYSIRELGIKEALLRAINTKPEKGTVNSFDRFHSIGG